MLVENTGLKLEGLDEKAVVYQSVFSQNLYYLGTPYCHYISKIKSIIDTWHMPSVFVKKSWVDSTKFSSAMWFSNLIVGKENKYLIASKSDNFIWQSLLGKLIGMCL